MDSWKLEPAHDLNLPLRDRFRSVRRESGLIETIGHLAWWTTVRAYLRGFHGLRVTGREHIPKQPPFVLVSNHASHLDALVLASQLSYRWRDCTFPIAAGDTFFDDRLTAAFAAVALNALPMWRKGGVRHAIEDLRHRLIDEACIYVIFPEGTRSRDGEIGKFKPGIGMIVAESDVPVIPCYLIGTHKAMPPDRTWPRPGRIELRIGAPRSFKEIRNDRAGWEQIANSLQQAVQQLTF
jgi:1-acyl-sn-glycerol-3-phosphate acyltransferase